MRVFILKDRQGNTVGEAEHGLGISVKYRLYNNVTKEYKTNIFDIRKKFRLLPWDVKHL